MSKSISVLSLFILVLSLFFRLWLLDQTSLHMDEVTWMSHSKELITSIVHHNASFFREKAWWNWKSENYSIGLPANFLGGASYTFLGRSSHYGFKLFSDPVAARLPIALLTALLPLLVFRFMVQVGKQCVGFVAALGLSISPLMLASDRWFLNDGLLALFSFLALTSFYLAAKNKILSPLPGLWLMLSFLTKPHGVLVTVGWLTCVFLVSDFKFFLRLLVLNFLVFYSSTVLFWPTAWFNPLFAIPEYLWRQTGLAQVPVTSLFQGAVVDDPGHLYYPFHLFLKNPEIVVLSFICAVILFLNETRKKQIITSILPFLMYCGTFYLLLSFSGTKAGPRYLVPLIPWVYVVASFGFVWIYERVKNIAFRLSFTALGLLSLLGVFLYFPETQIYFNQFFGGPYGVAGYSRLNVCLGEKQALIRLDQAGYSGSYYLYGCADNGPYYTGRSQTKDIRKSDYAIVETWLWEMHPHDEVMTYVESNYHIIASVREYGVETAKIYARK